MNSYRVLRNTVVTMLAASTMVGSMAIGRAEEMGQAEEAGQIGQVGQVGQAEAEQAGEIAEPALRAPTRTIHRAVWFTRTAPRIRPVVRAPKVRNKAIAFRLVARRSWSHDQFQCLDSLWTRESNWNHQAHNPSSGAYGIPQALPGSKMSDSGGDWRSNPITQIHWGLRYIKSRYGSPCGAWGHFRSSNWY
ncbi:lytic transglycosylase domain-containing protein [Streptosporangium sp. NPDC006007]|uniref:aggregation-promoting factor C-terminal-like domain-containing protein n=1 Tax=Streptosporangium sp. NPDC006007 TaxID=3154575 RepID=UPI0033BEF6A0